jgi:hypothetical protein
MASAYTYEQSMTIVDQYKARIADCPLCGQRIRFMDASFGHHWRVRFECTGCGALDDSDRAPDSDD